MPEITFLCKHMDVNIGKRGGGGGLGKTGSLWFWSVALTFAGVWLLLPSLLHSAYKGDTIELQIIAKEWVWSTPKHPMMSAWLLEICNILTHRAFAAPFIASAFCTILILYSVWQLGRNVLPEKFALIGTFAMLPYLPLTLKSHLYNPNTALMLFWTLTIFTFYYAFQTNKTRWWIAAGLSLGLGLHAKYTIVLLGFALLFYSLWFPRFRRHWKQTGPWLTALIACVVFSPHLIWLYQQDALLTFNYVQEELAKRPPIIGPGWDRLACPIIFVLGELGLLAVSPLLLLVPILGWHWKRRLPDNETERETLNYLLCCMGIPFLLLIFASGIKEIARTTYGFPLWFFLGIYLLLQFQRRDSHEALVRSAKWAGLAVTVFVVVFVIQALYDPHITGTPSRYHYPMRELGAECDRIWQERFHVPCRHVTGDEWIHCGFAAHNMNTRPSVHCYYGAVPMGEWVAYDKVNQKGGIVLWDASDFPEQFIPDWVHRHFPRAEVLPEKLEFPYKTRANIQPLRIGIALVPPPSSAAPNPTPTSKLLEKHKIVMRQTSG